METTRKQEILREQERKKERKKELSREKKEIEQSERFFFFLKDTRRKLATTKHSHPKSPNRVSFGPAQN